MPYVLASVLVCVLQNHGTALWCDYGHRLKWRTKKDKQTNKQTNKQRSEHIAPAKKDNSKRNKEASKQRANCFRFFIYLLYTVCLLRFKQYVWNIAISPQVQIACANSHRHHIATKKEIRQLRNKTERAKRKTFRSHPPSQFHNFIFSFYANLREMLWYRI